jgi:hypothetical protein
MQLNDIAKKINDLIEDGVYSSIIFCELCSGDLDILKYFNFSSQENKRVTIMRRSQILGDELKPHSGDNFIGTRFHFRMLMEYSGATGITLLSDEIYYLNKHKSNVECNFIFGRSRVLSISDFMISDIKLELLRLNLSSFKFQRYRIFLKKIEKIIINLFLRLRQIF